MEPNAPTRTQDESEAFRRLRVRLTGFASNIMNAARAWPASVQRREGLSTVPQQVSSGSQHRASAQWAAKLILEGFEIEIFTPFADLAVTQFENTHHRQ